MTKTEFCVVSWLLLVGEAVGQDVTKSEAVNSADKGKWVNISETTTKKIIAAGGRIVMGKGAPEMTNGCGIVGVGVDRTNGDVYMAVVGYGIWKSVDHGTTFERIDGGKLTSRGQARCIDADPEGKRFMFFMMSGNAELVLESGATAVETQLSHVECGATDWSDGKTMLAVYHEKNGEIAASFDGGAKWKTIGKGFWYSPGVFDARTLIITKYEEGGGILRSQDAGETWTKVSGLIPTPLKPMKVFKGAGYFTSRDGLLVSKDKGATWAIQGKPLACANGLCPVQGKPTGCLEGPLFGKDEKHLVVAAKEGLMETTDGGETWKIAAPYPTQEWDIPLVGRRVSLKPDPAFSFYAWDPQNDIFYASGNYCPLMKYQR
ncbi:MAG: hypothetical protein C0404_14015 [Verrucomicrobia bacterium]|nr:hypothetical protein [Verrucomicrobiota bacterium]